jgi:hypothetical protein
MILSDVLGLIQRISAGIYVGINGDRPTLNVCLELQASYNYASSITIMPLSIFQPQNN